MSQPHLVIHVSGGVVQEVFSSDRDADIILVDWDVARSNSVDPNVVSVPIRQRTVRAYVAAFAPQPLHELAGSDLEQAVEAAFAQGILAEPVCETAG